MLLNKEHAVRENPPEIPSPRSWRDLAVLVVGVVVVVACLNILAGWYLKDHTFNRGYWIISQKGKVLSSLQKGGYWLIVGDSSGNFGVVPEVLDRQLGVRSVNLCTVADMLTMDDFFMVDSYIKRHGAPQGVLMVHAYDAWPRRGEPGAFARSDWPVKKIGDFLGLNRDERMELLLKRYFPLFSESTTLTQMSLMPRTAFFSKGLPFTINRNGYMPLLEASSGVAGDARYHLKHIKEVSPEISTFNQAGLQAIADLADQYRFEVYIVNSPLYGKLLQHGDFEDYFNTVHEKLREIVKHQKHLHILPFDNDLTFPANQMENVDHVIFTTAKIYTKRIAARIRSAMGEAD